MKKVRSIINIALGSMVAALSFSNCEGPRVKYGVDIEVKYGSPYIDTTAHCMYGVNPNPNVNWDEDIEENNE